MDLKAKDITPISREMGEQLKKETGAVGYYEVNIFIFALSCVDN